MLYFFENFVLDPARRELRRGKALIAVQPQVFDLLEYLITHRDRVVSKDDILGAVWGGRIVSESALTTRINATRAAVDDDGDQQRLIRTIPRRGIRFVGPVQERAHLLDPAASAPAVVEVETPEPAGREKAASAERRQLTIASCELLLGPAAAGMDPEDLREIIQSYHSSVAETACRHNGLVAHTYGNTSVLYFGYPEAHEDDPERAVRAALGLVAAVPALKAPTPLQTRVGIATGLVVVGEMTDASGAQQHGIIGETPSIAAQLQALAEPNTAVIAESTRKLLGNLFDLQDLGTKDLKGIVGPVRAWAALRPSLAASRFEALHSSGLTDLVGREEELELLLRRWSRAKVGEGQVMLLSGEPGIGKSRLDCGGRRSHRLRAANPFAQFLLAAAHRQRPLPAYLPNGARSRIYPRRHLASEARQAQQPARTKLNVRPRCRAFCRDAVAAERRTLSGARTNTTTA
jgi:DNA-binding winged helix-turn-helix (wHTH) protein